MSFEQERVLMRGTWYFDVTVSLLREAVCHLPLHNAASEELFGDIQQLMPRIEVALADQAAVVIDEMCQ